MTEKRKISELTEVTTLGEQDELVLVHYDSGPVGPEPTPTPTPLSTTIITDTNFQTAVDLWFTNQSLCIATYGHISDWDVSAVTNMNSAFADRPSFPGAQSARRSLIAFNVDISGWDVGNVTDMKYMFAGTPLPVAKYLANTSFNQDIGGWDVSSVTEMDSMFSRNNAFNQDISAWDVSSVTSTAYMFECGGLGHASAFDNGGQAMTWGNKIGNCRQMDGMFQYASSFNRDISGWDVRKCWNMTAMFSGATAFNQNIGSWNVGAVTHMESMFYGATSLNQNLSGWSVGSVTNCLSFNTNAHASMVSPTFTHCTI